MRLLLEQGQEELSAVRRRQRRSVTSTAGHWAGLGCVWASSNFQFLSSRSSQSLKRLFQKSLEVRKRARESALRKNNKKERVGERERERALLLFNELM